MEKLDLGTNEESITSRTTETSATNVRECFSKYVQLDPEKYVSCPPVIHCSLPPHRSTFSFNSFEAYEVHYAKIHKNHCSECGRNFPTDHILSLHIEENHNPLLTMRQERGEKMYACFVEDCDRRCSTPQKRRMHLIDKHLYPKDYDFFIINHGTSNRSSLLKSWNHKTYGSDSTYRSRNVANATKHKTTIDQPTALKCTENDISVPKTNTDIDMVTSAMSALRFIPPSVRFGGHGPGKAKDMGR